MLPVPKVNPERFRKSCKACVLEYGCQARCQPFEWEENYDAETDYFLVKDDIVVRDDGVEYVEL